MRFPALLLIGCLLTGCGKKAPEPVGYGSQIQPILNNRCVSCHGAAKAEGGIQLESYASLMSSRILPGKKPLVISGDYVKSWLYILCSTDQPHYRMPPDSAKLTPLPKEELELIANWILQGAQDN